MSKNSTHDETWTITVEDKKCVVHKPSRKIVEACIPLVTKDKLITAGELILSTCWVEGDDIIKTDEDFLMAAALQAVDIIQVKKADLKKN